MAVIPGTDGPDVLVGTNEADTINGGLGNDVLRGLFGNDVLNGGNGADRLFGSRGRDTIFAGVGADLVHGGGGPDDIYAGGRDGFRDIIRYESLLESGPGGRTRDDIFRFDRITRADDTRLERQSRDKIDLRKIDADPSTGANDKFTLTSDVPDTGEVRLVYNSRGTLIQVNGDGDAEIDMTIQVRGVRITEFDLLL